MLERIVATRVCARPAALDALHGELVRLAPDEALMLAPCGEPADAAAIICRDAGWFGLATDEAGLAAIAERHCAWRLPDARPATARGALAGLPVVIWLPGDGRAVVLVPAPYAAEFEERLA